MNEIDLLDNFMEGITDICNVSKKFSSLAQLTGDVSSEHSLFYGLTTSDVTEVVAATLNGLDENNIKMENSSVTALDALKSLTTVVHLYMNMTDATFAKLVSDVVAICHRSLEQTEASSKIHEKQKEIRGQINTHPYLLTLIILENIIRD